MKNLKKLFLLYFSLFLVCTSVLGQSSSDEPHSIITIIRGDRDPRCKTEITIQCQDKFMIQANSIVKYKIYSEGRVVISMKSHCKHLLSTNNSINQVTLNVKQGVDSFVYCNPDSLAEVTKSTVQNDLDNLKIVNNFEEGSSTKAKQQPSHNN